MLLLCHHFIGAAKLIINKVRLGMMTFITIIIVHSEANPLEREKFLKSRIELEMMTNIPAFIN
jgi:hypothetical protein